MERIARIFIVSPQTKVFSSCNFSSTMDIFFINELSSINYYKDFVNMGKNVSFTFCKHEFFIHEAQSKEFPLYFRKLYILVI